MADGDATSRTTEAPGFGTRTKQLGGRFWKILAISLVLPGIGKAFLYDEFRWPETIFLALFILVIGALVSIESDVQVLRDRAAIEWIGRNEADASLIECRKMLTELRAAHNDLFVEYFEDELDTARDRLCDAVSVGRLEVKHTYDTRVQLLHLLEPTDDIWYVHFFRDNQVVFGDGDGQNLFRLVATAVHGKNIRGVRRLFVYETSTELSSPESTYLMQLHRARGFSCRVIDATRYGQAKEAHRVMEDDFGIYGSRYVYHWRGRERCGEFVSRTAEVERFLDFFRYCWDPSQSDEHPVRSLPKREREKPFRTGPFCAER